MTFIHLSYALLTWFILLVILEKCWVLRAPTHAWLARFIVNLLMGSLMLFSARYSVQPSSLSIMSWNMEHHIGLLYLIPGQSVILTTILGFLGLDLTFYYWHRANHRFALLWRFHNVHHTDPDLDVSTAIRFHFVEIIYSSLFRLVQLAMIGINPITFIIYEAVFQANTLLQHSNIRLPYHLEKYLVYVFVTPRMHGIHHSEVTFERDSNFSTVFSIWDRLHHSLTLNVTQSSLTIGVPAYQQAEDNHLIPLISQPFKKQRHYAFYANGKKAQRTFIGRKYPRSKLLED